LELVFFWWPTRGGLFGDCREGPYGCVTGFVPKSEEVLVCASDNGALLKHSDMYGGADTNYSFHYFFIIFVLRDVSQTE
jgi:hypothetical protein